MKSEIGKRKRAENALQESDAKFRTLIETMNDGLLVLDKNRFVTYVNSRTQEILGYPVAELVGHHVNDFLNEPNRRIMENQLKTRKEGKRGSYEISWTSKTGDQVATLTSGAPVFDSQARFVGSFGVITDIRKRKLAEEILRESEERFRAIFETAEDSIFIKDRNLRYTHVNPAMEKLFGLSARELAGRNDAELFGEKSGAHIAKTDARVLKGEVVQEEDTKPVNGLFVTFQVIKVPMRDRSGRVTGLCGIARDITKQKAAEKKIKNLNMKLEVRVEERTRELRTALEQLVKEIDDHKRTEAALMQAKEIAIAANKAKSEFLTSMNHELRTPLNAVIGFAEVLQDKHFGSLTEKQAEYTRHIIESGHHLLALITDILDLSGIESEKIQLEFSTFLIRNMLENSIVLIREKALKHGILLHLNLDPGLDTMHGDEKRIRQVVFNLLSNAVKFTPDGGEIRISANPTNVASVSDKKKSGAVGPVKPQTKNGHMSASVSNFEASKNWIKFSVEDTGIGIAATEQEKIFEEFYQAQNGIGGKTPGTGLGLSLARCLVEMHGGRIWVESPGKNTGSNFIFILPLISEGEKGTPPDLKATV